MSVHSEYSKRSAPTIEPMAKTRPAGGRFWKPGIVDKNQRFSYYFEVPVVDRAGHFARVAGWIPARVHAWTFKQSESAIGSVWEYAIEVLALDPKDFSPSRVIQYTKCKSLYPTRQEAMRKATNASVSIYDRLRTDGITPGVVGKYMREYLEVEGDTDGNSNEEASA